MVFSSTTFLLAFLPLVGILYFICPKKLRNALLLVFSLLFYGWGEPKYILIMLFSTVFDYCNGLAIGHFRTAGKPKGAKAVLVVSVVGNLSILGFFKYTDFAITNLNGLLGTAVPALGLLLPIGISFYTFQTMSYTIDVYRGVVPPQRNIIDFSAYVTLFPQLIAGPIVQYKTVAADLENRSRESLADASAGMQRFVIGLGKKVLLANQMGAVWEEIAAMSAPSVVTAWLGALAFTFQIYFDFSGYSDMAIGIALLLGFHFNINFDSPYKSASITEFWRRWHISLSSWLRDYLYISLGGNRKGKIRQYANLIITMFLGGLWHGASWNFVLWGMMHGVALAAHKFWMTLTGRKKGTESHGIHRFLGVLVTFHFVCFCWIFFRNAEFSTSMDMLKQIFTTFRPQLFPQLVEGYWEVFALMALGYLLHFVPDSWERACTKTVIRLPLLGKAVLMLAVIYLVIQMKSSEIQPFIYFQF